ncbi:hypothetical protein FUA48_09890 [Flavobacterium alkalisoli]|uniref:Phosphoribosylpyrophosphate synthetase n=1 Tax=Flavobacterium alkalisoli TaxID=2602769 RepID=A0A5B9FUJ9_9FLAO|nr:hypothetical protein [Flavobacterium alkalisoli]QEE49881.1 hypothetical protein FUA48_09890 [Flavobacterium alkalisoli]
MERQMYHYATVSKALRELAEKGFTVDFNLKENHITEHPEDFEIVHVYRYEGESDPSDEATVYGIKSSKGEQGVYVAGQGANSEKGASTLLHKLSTKGRD